MSIRIFLYKKPKHAIGKKRCRVPRDEGLGAAWYNASCFNRFCLQRQLSDDKANPAVTRLWFTSYRIIGQLSILLPSALTYVLTRAFNVLEQHHFPWYHKVQIWSHENPRENHLACLDEENYSSENVKSTERQWVI